MSAYGGMRVLRVVASVNPVTKLHDALKSQKAPLMGVYIDPVIPVETIDMVIQSLMAMSDKVPKGSKTSSTEDVR